MKLKFNLSTKLAIYFAVLSIIPVLLLGFFFYQRMSTILMNQYAQDKQKIIEEQAIIIENFVNNAKDSLLFLTQTASLQKLINSQDLNEQTVEKARLTNNLYQLSKQKSQYYQLRYIDETGQEIVRIDSVDNHSFVVSKEKLQNKSDRYYFTIANNYQAGEVYISPLDLNIENGKLENRGTISNPQYVPTVRLATPVFSQKGQRKGILVSNLYANKFLDNFRQISKDNDLYLINNRGYFLGHYDSSQEYSFMFNQDPPVLKLWGDLVDPIFSQQDSGQYYSQKNQYLITYQRLLPTEKIIDENGINQETWILLQITPRKKIIASLWQDLGYFSLFLIILLFFLIALIPYFTRQFTITLSEITQASEQLNQGNYEVNLKPGNDPDLNKLTANFNKLAKTLKHNQEVTESQIKTRTSQLTRINQSMVNRELKMIELKKRLRQLKK